MTPTTVGELLHWSYANLAMAHSAVNAKAERYGRLNFMVRSRLFKGLQAGTIQMGSIAEDERLKLYLPQACCYCAARSTLSVDHLISTRRGGKDGGDNFVWACRSCNSSKGASDVLQWLAAREQFPSLLLLRRYLKLAIEICDSQGIMSTPVQQAPPLPIDLSAIPINYPQPKDLALWIMPID